MTYESGIFEQDDEEAIAASIARGRADIAAGRYVEHEKIVAWLKTWGTPDWKPMPREWLE